MVSITLFLCLVIKTPENIEDEVEVEGEVEDEVEGEQFEDEFEIEEIVEVKVEKKLDKAAAAAKMCNDIVEDIWDTTLEICSERFLHRAGPNLVALELRNTWLRIVEVCLI